MSLKIDDVLAATSITPYQFTANAIFEACHSALSKPTKSKRAKPKEVTAAQLYGEAWRVWMCEASCYYVAERAELIEQHYGRQLCALVDDVVEAMRVTHHEHWNSLLDLSIYDDDDQAACVANAIAALDWYRNHQAHADSLLTEATAAAWLATHQQPEQMALL